VSSVTSVIPPASVVSTAAALLWSRDRSPTATAGVIVGDGAGRSGTAGRGCCDAIESLAGVAQRRAEIVLREASVPPRSIDELSGAAAAIDRSGAISVPTLMSE
jgi:hypothetical protein